ncbi:MAG: hypothetical protein DBY04_01305 [Clostridiales bacterium]|nr:MAG: hypothetical protein DBY04_01305 [Clostridiales bacterium]
MKKQKKNKGKIVVSLTIVIVTVVVGILAVIPALQTEQSPAPDPTSGSHSDGASVKIPEIKPNPTDSSTYVPPDMDVQEMTRNPNPEVIGGTVEYESGGIA